VKDKIFPIALIIGLVGAVGCLFGYRQDPAHFFHSYLVAYIFFLTILLGALFFTMLHHLTGARWSVVLRRIAESAGAALPLFLILFLPLFAGLHHLYPWSQGGHGHKTPYLNLPFFATRAVFYLLVWSVLGWGLRRLSLRQDREKGFDLAPRAKRLSAPGMILFAFTITYASIDWLMALDSHWYSTIFGVYVFSGAVVSSLAFLAIASVILPRLGILEKEITVEHRHDLGKLLFGFTVFWAYIVFSQYFLIWYSNVPEETGWFLRRWHGSWKPLSLVIVFGHFVVPFLVLMGRAAKRSAAVLFAASVLLLLVHYVDLYWIVMPNLYPEGAKTSWIDLAALMMIAGFTRAFFWKLFTSAEPLPVNDPNLQTSLEFENY